MDKKISCLIDAALKNADMKQAQNGVLYLGLTRAGKSSLVSQQIGCELEYYDDDVSLMDSVRIVCCPPGDAPTIGDKPKAHTLFPHGYTGSDRIHIDFPGFDGSRGDEEMLGVLSTQVALKSLKHIKHVVVLIDYADIAGKNARNLARVFEALSLLVKHMDAHKEDITLVVSKAQGIIGKTLAKQKERVAKALLEFDEALTTGNYRNEISDTAGVRKFIRLFTDPMTHDSMVLFHLSDQARDELSSRINGGSGISPAEIGFLADRSHADEFYKKIKGELGNAVDVLKFMAGFSEQEKLSVQNLEAAKKNWREKTDQFNYLKNNKPKLVLPHNENHIKDKHVQKFTVQHNAKQTVMMVNLNYYPKLMNEAKVLGSLDKWVDKYGRMLSPFGVGKMSIEVDIVRMIRENEVARSNYQKALEKWAADVERLKQEVDDLAVRVKVLENQLAYLRAEYKLHLEQYCVNKDFWVKWVHLHRAIEFNSDLYSNFSLLFGKVSSQIDSLSCVKYPSPLQECQDYTYADSARYPLCAKAEPSCPESAFAVFSDGTWSDAQLVVHGNCLPASFVGEFRDTLPSTVPVDSRLSDSPYPDSMYAVLSLLAAILLLRLFSLSSSSARSVKQPSVSFGSLSTGSLNFSQNFRIAHDTGYTSRLNT